MLLELAEVVAGFPLAASFAIAGGIGLVREGRRRASLNEAVHELRRPLQVMTLSVSANPAAPHLLESSLRLAAVAVDRLEREINGGMTVTEFQSVAVRDLVEAAVARWRPHAALTDRTLTLRWKAGAPLLRGDGFELEQALDNLINNGFEHGRGEVAIEVREVREMLQVRVLDSGALASPSRRRAGRRGWVRLGGRNRHGHGLRVVRRAASRHGGSFHLRGTPYGTEARLELPLGKGTR